MRTAIATLCSRGTFGGDGDSRPPDGESTDRRNRAVSQARDLLASGKEGLDGVVGRVRTESERGIEGVRERYDLDARTLNERIVERVLGRCEEKKGAHPEQPALRGLSVLEDALAGYDPDEGELGDALIETLCDEYDVEIEELTDEGRESPLDRYGLDADRLSERLGETLRAGNGAEGTRRGPERHRNEVEGGRNEIDGIGGEADGLGVLLDGIRRGIEETRDEDHRAGRGLETLGREVGARYRGSDGTVLPGAVGPALAVLVARAGHYGADSTGPDGALGTASGEGFDLASTALGAFRAAVRQYETRANGGEGKGESDSDSRGRITRALAALFVANFVAMSAGAWYSYRNAPPIPDEIRDPDGEVIVTAEQVRDGKKAFQSAGLMNHGSILGNGGYFGVDLTADALSLKTEHMRAFYARERGAPSFDDLSTDERAAVRTRVERELDDASGPDAEYSPAEAAAHRRIREEYVSRYHEGDPEKGIPAGFVSTEEQARRIADFALWTAWIAHADRPDAGHSYTNDWPYAPDSANRPTSQSLLWSAVSVILLVGGGGIGVWAYRALDLAEPITDEVRVPTPDEVSVTPAQRAAARYVPVASVLFTLQTLLGALLAHYHVERTGFFGLFDALGIDIVSLVPFAAARTWHVNLAILWITTLWLGGGLFLPGLFTDHEPRYQATGVTALLGALVVATVGAFVGVWCGIQGTFDPLSGGDWWWWIGNEGLEYLEAGRLWKAMLLAGFVGWAGLVVRAAGAGTEGEGETENDARSGDGGLFPTGSRTGLGHLLVYAGGSIALLFGASMLYTPETNMAVTEFWRWWVVHMWVEGAFEFFMIAVVSIALVAMDLLEQEAAEKAILFEVFTIMAAGIVGVSHHYWWVGLPDLWVPIGTTFSTLEFVPILFVLYRALGEYRSLAARGAEFPYTVPFLFIVGATVWNFVGAGVLGFFLNIPILNYYEHGTFLTLAHSHAATFGAFGLLALGLGAYILRVVTPESAWDPTWFRRSFWLSNVGLCVMVVGSLLPVGFLQLETVYEEGFATARSTDFYDRPLVQKLLWARVPGDSLVLCGALAFTASAIGHLRRANGAESQPTPA